MAQPDNACAYVAFEDYNWQGIIGSSEKGSRCHGLALGWNPTVICLFVSMFAVSIWIGVEVNVQAMTTFKRWSTVYFWSIIWTAWAVILYALSVALLLFAEQGKSLVVRRLYPTAWVLTNIGAIAVLYSRLHLILVAPRAFRWLAFVLIGIGIPFQVFLVVANSRNDENVYYLGTVAHNVAYRLEVVITFVEIALVAAYIYFFTMRFFRAESSTFMDNKKDAQLRQTLVVLILGELLVVAGDVAIIAVWLDGYFLVRVAIGPLVNAIKLKVEFLILNCLTGMAKQRAELRHVYISTGNQTNEAAISAAVDAAQNVLEDPDSIHVHVCTACTQAGERPKTFDSITSTALPRSTADADKCV